MQKKYIVHIGEVHVSSRIVVADNAEEAIELAKDMDNVLEENTEYSHSLGDERITVEPVEDSKPVKADDEVEDEERWDTSVD